MSDATEKRTRRWRHPASSRASAASVAAPLGCGPRPGSGPDRCPGPAKTRAEASAKPPAGPLRLPSLEDRAALYNGWLEGPLRARPARGHAPGEDRHVGRHLPRARRGPRLSDAHAPAEHVRLAPVHARLLRPGRGGGRRAPVRQSLRQRRLQQGDRRLLPARLDGPSPRIPGPGWPGSSGRGTRSGSRSTSRRHSPSPTASRRRSRPSSSPRSGPGCAGRVVSAERLAVGWLEKRTAGGARILRPDRRRQPRASRPRPCRRRSSSPA